MGKTTIAVTWWGSGGHITPLVSLLNYVHTSNEFMSKCNDIYWFGEKNSLEQKACKEIPWVHFVEIPAGKIRRYWWLSAVRQNIKDILNVGVGVGRARWELRRRNIDIVFGKWGYVSFPVCFAAWTLWIKVIIHESDLFPGLANRLLYPFASKVFMWFESPWEKYGWKSEYVGQILSLQLWDEPHSNFVGPQKTDKTVVLILWWSQWATALFEAMKKIWDRTWAWSYNFQFIVTVGTKNVQYKEIFSKYPNVFTYEYLSPAEMGVLYKTADIAITRGGVTSLAEQKLFGIKSCIVPTPFTGGNHQLWNARWYEAHYGDVCIEQNDGLEMGIEKFLEQHISYKKSWSVLSQDPIKKTYTRIMKELLVN